MTRIALVAFSIAAAGLVGCGGGTDTDGDGSGGTGGQGGTTCTLSSQCELGEICSKGVCVEDSGCTADSCSGNDLCDAETLTCLSPATICSNEGCECSIVDPVAGVVANPSIVLSANGEREVQVVVTVKNNGQQVPGAAYALEVENDPMAAFELNAAGTTVIATDNGGEAQLKATVVDDAGNPIAGSDSCTAVLKNLGEVAPADARVYVFNDITGEPIAGARVEIHTDNDGIADHVGNTQDDQSGKPGEALFAGIDLNGPYDVTVFAHDANNDIVYNYVTLAGITGNDIQVPLSGRSPVAQVGGYTGKVDFKPFEERYLNGVTKLLSAAIASNSIPLAALLNFDLSVLIGELPEGECTPTGGTLPRGCYQLSIPGLDQFEIPPFPLPGGTQIAVQGAPAKGSVDVVGVPGKRTAWTLGGEVGLGEVTPLIPIITPLLPVEDCDCDTTDACDDACTCDSDCGLNLDFGAIFNGVLPLLPNFGSGVRTNVNLVATSETDWVTYTTAEYDNRTPNSNYPNLDDGTGGLGKLQLTQALDKFTNFEAPALPSDGAGGQMEALVLLTGILGPEGFVPLGLSAGLDCTASEGCLDRAANPDLFDGKVNGGKVCNWNSKAQLNQCPRSVDDALEGQVPAGRVGMFHAPAHGGLDKTKWVTIAAALPLSSFLSQDDLEIRVTGFVVREEPAAGQSNQIKKSFVEVPASIAYAADRTYTVPNVAGTDVHWITFGSEADSATGLTTRWNVYAASGATVKLPAVPTGWVDPAAPDNDDDGDIPEGYVNVTHLAVDLEGSAGLESYAANNGTHLGDLVQNVSGLSVLSGNVCIQNCN